jgi:hypothetical protein
MIAKKVGMGIYPQFEIGCPTAFPYLLVPYSFDLRLTNVGDVPVPEMKLKFPRIVLHSNKYSLTFPVYYLFLFR